MRLHTHALSLALLGAVTTSLDAQAALRPQPSSRAMTEVTLNYPRDSAPAGAVPMSIRLEYGQPHLRGRALNTDSLVPYDRAWRTGANAATTLTTGVDLLIGGQRVPKGTYVLWTLPTRTSWQLIVQRSTAPGSMEAAMVYDTANDVARINLMRHTLAAPMESLTMWLIPSTTGRPARGELRISWGNTMLMTDWVVQ